MNAAIEYLTHVLVARLRATEAGHTKYEPGFMLREAVLHLPRLILVVSGSVRYRLDRQSWVLKAGDMALAPAYCRRSWVAGSAAPLTLAWFAYSVEPTVEEVPTLLRARSADVRMDDAAMRRIRELHDEHPGEHSLESEGEMKAMLARFLVRAASAAPMAPTGDRPNQAELAVTDAARWLTRHFAQSDAIEAAVERSRLSLNHFRLVFKRRIGVSPQRFLTQLRMRAARFHLHETQDSVKEVAQRVGYADAFHFSRTYRKFWGNPPVEDRRYGP